MVPEGCQRLSWRVPLDKPEVSAASAQRSGATRAGFVLFSEATHFLASMMPM
ncbi:hypothetical protein ACVWXO_006396 [Bradyrhizobium sp. LM2.7]